MKIHFISIGGKAMHNLALALVNNGYKITGSDDEIYNPSRDRLDKAGLLPSVMGWFPERITTDLDAVILGMHARPDNPEIAKAKSLGIPIYSYPEFLYQESKNKKRVVVAGSHGKTTTTSMIMHVLSYHNQDFDYMVGAQLEGYERMVRLSDAPIIVLEGDEYLSSPIDRRPKFLHYKPHITIVTGIAWDHINVFPTFENYVEQFEKLMVDIEVGGSMIYYEPDEILVKLAAKARKDIQLIPYQAFDSTLENGQTFLHTEHGEKVGLQVFGQHNLANFKAAHHACRMIGLSDEQFLEAIPTFKGASKRLQVLKEKEDAVAFLDYAHAPSKLEATINAVKEQYPDRALVACFELHTFSSLNKNFLPHYKDTMRKADIAVVFYSEHTLKMKKLPFVSKEEVAEGFNHPNIRVFTERANLEAFLRETRWKAKNLLMMSSGTFSGMNYQEFAEALI